MKHLGIVTALLLALAVALAGCGGSMEAKLVGKWKGTANLPKDKANDPMAAMAQAMLANISLELKKDKTFVMTMMVPIEGTWTLEGSQVKLHVTKAMGMSTDDLKAKAEKMGQTKANEDINKPMVLDVSADGTELKVVPDANSKQGMGELTFKKEAA